MGIEQFGDNERAIEQDADRKRGGYEGDYYDENEHRAGQEKRDLATGESIRNDGDIETPHDMGIDGEGKLIVMKEKLSEDVVTKKQKKLQEMADELLKAYGSDELGTEPPQEKEDRKAA